MDPPNQSSITQLLLRVFLKTYSKNVFSPAGNRTPVSRVTGGDTYHYTTEDTFVADKISLRMLVILFLASPKTTIFRTIALQHLKGYPQQPVVPNQRTQRPTATEISDFISILHDLFADEL